MIVRDGPIYSRRLRFAEQLLINFEFRVDNQFEFTESAVVVWIHTRGLNADP